MRATHPPPLPRTPQHVHLPLIPPRRTRHRLTDLIHGSRLPLLHLERGRKRDGRLTEPRQALARSQGLPQLVRGVQLVPFSPFNQPLHLRPARTVIHVPLPRSRARDGEVYTVVHVAQPPHMLGLRVHVDGRVAQAQVLQHLLRVAVPRVAVLHVRRQMRVDEGQGGAVQAQRHRLATL